MEKNMTERVIQPTIVHLGEGTFTEEAALDFISEVNEQYGLLRPIGVGSLMPEHPDIAHIFEAVSRGVATYGIAPMENSTVAAGHIQETVDTLMLLENGNLQIDRELIMRISQSLYRRRSALITTIASKDKAIQQCENKLKAMYPSYTPWHTDSTVSALELLKDRPYIAAIARPGLLEEFKKRFEIENLEEIGGMEDNSFNTTRFIVFGQKNDVSLIASNYKTTMALTIEDQPGSLFGCLDTLASNGINLNEIKASSLRVDHAAQLLVSIDGHQEEADVRMALSKLKKEIIRVRLLGSYPKADYTPYQTEEMPDIDYLAEQIRKRVSVNGRRSDHSVIIFTLPNELGALAHALEPLKEINLTDADSIATNGLGRYAFYLSFHNHISNKEDLIAKVEERCEQMRVLEMSAA